MKLQTILLLILSGLLCVVGNVSEHQSKSKYQTPINGSFLETPINGSFLETPINGSFLETPINGSFLGEMLLGVCVLGAWIFLIFGIFGIRPGPN
jgi:hypothetical protein